MASERDNLTEEELNRRQAEQIENARDVDLDDDGGIIDTVDRAFESVIDPIVTPDADDRDPERQRHLNDQAARES